MPLSPSEDDVKIWKLGENNHRFISEAELFR